MGSEAALRGKLKEVAGRIELPDHYMRVENTTMDGTPDVNWCINGDENWVELKQINEWPKRDTTIVKAGIRRAQVEWLTDRGRAGGRAFLLVQVGREYLLFSWRHVPALFLGQKKSWWFEHCLLKDNKLVDLIDRFIRGGV